jgi:low affinity Fe/Cu permease
MQRRPFHGWIQDEFPGWSVAAVRLIGHSNVVALVFGMAIVWLVLGLSWGFPAEWLLLTNLLCTMVIFLRLLMVRHAQNGKMQAVQTKLDALITLSEAGSHWIAAEQLDVEAIDEMGAQHHAPITTT